MRPPDIDNDAIGVERLGNERGVDHKGRAMQGLRRAEHGPAERMGDHDVVADFDGEQGTLLKVVR